MRDRQELLQSLEYRLQIDTERVTEEGVRDYLWVHTKIGSARDLWCERYHGDETAARGLDPEWTLRISDSDGGRQYWPHHRTFRSMSARERRQMVEPPDAYLALLSWWPDAEGPILRGEPLSLLELLEAGYDEGGSEAIWSVREEGAVLRLESDSLVFELDPSRGFCVLSRTCVSPEGTVRFEGSGFRDVGGVWLASRVTQTAAELGAEPHFEMRCQVDRVRINEVDAASLVAPEMPGLYDISDSADPEDGRFRQVAAGGEELLLRAARKLEERFDRGRGAVLRDVVVPALVGAAVGWLLTWVLARAFGGGRSAV